jgi:hypothetical protein
MHRVGLLHTAHIFLLSSTTNAWVSVCGVPLRLIVQVSINCCVLMLTSTMPDIWLNFTPCHRSVEAC